MNGVDDNRSARTRTNFLSLDGDAVSSADSTIELAYQQRIAALTPMDRVARSAAMFQWTREQIARQIVVERGPTDADTLKWLVALRLYGNEPAIRELIERKLGHVSR